MKLWKIYYTYFFLFLFLLNTNYIICEDACQINCEKSDSSCTAKADVSYDCSNCKPVYDSNSNKCCSVGNSGYFSLDSSGNCIDGCLGDKIIEDTKECTNVAITGKYQLGDIYLTNAPTDTSISCSNNICECTKYFYKEIIYGKTKIHCYNSYEPSSFGNYKFFNYKTGEFFTSCPSGFNIKKENAISTATRCSDKCLDNEFYLSTTTNNIITEKCVDSCSSPNNLQYEDNGIKKCVQNCPSGLKIKQYDTFSACVTVDECKFYEGIYCKDSCTGTNLLNNYGSKECISSCTGDFVYRKDPDDNTCYKRENCNFYDDSDSNNKKCLDTCNTYHDYNSKKCISHCGLDGVNKLYYAGEGDYKNICFSSCLKIPSRDYIYEEQDVNTHNYRKCFKEKPTDDCEKYYLKINGVRKCSTQQNCIDKLYTYFVGDECRESCDGYYQLEDSTNSFVKCYNNLANALDDTNIKFCDTNLKKCWTSSSLPEEYFIKSEFSSNSGKYEVVKQCTDFYYEDDHPSDNTKKSNWCIKKCITKAKFYINNNKKCFDSCNEIYKYYYDDNNECIDSCELRPTKPFSYKLSNNNPEQCRDSCNVDPDENTNKYYNYNSHICLNECGEDNSINLYHKNGEYICYPSCLDIPPRGTINYIISEHECSSSCNNNNDYYYKINEGLFKCVTAANDCTDLGYNYLTEHECSNKCDNNYYKLNSSPLIKCFSEPKDCLDGATGPVYYNEESKTCWTSSSIASIINNYYVDTVSNIDPNDSTSSKIYKLVNNCEKYYYINTEDNNYKYCINDCKTKDLFFLNGNKECKTDCINDNFQKYYYDPYNNECLDTCKGRPIYKYQVGYTTTPTSSIECINNCIDTTDTKYNNFDSNICLNYCGADDSNKKYHAYDKYLCYSSCLEIPGDYKYELKSTNDYICYTQYDDILSASTNCPYYYIKDDGIKVCQSETECKEKNYK